MRIGVIGLGYVGITTAVCLAELSNDMFLYDVNSSRVHDLLNNNPHIKEKGLKELIYKNINKLNACLSIRDVCDSSEIIFLSVNTPFVGDSLDLSRVEAVIKEIDISAENSQKRVSVVIRSTVEPGIMKKLVSEVNLDYISLFLNPEFLREGSAVSDFFNPPKIVIGKGIHEPVLLKKIYEKINAPYIELPYESAEVCKLIDNSWHAIKVSFGNEIGRILDSLGLDVNESLTPFFCDTKLNISSHYLKPGNAYGGSCLTKDSDGLTALGKRLNTFPFLLGSARESNFSHIVYITSKIINLYCKINSKGFIYINGVSFKEGTNDMRESPSLYIGARLRRDGYPVRYIDEFVSLNDLDSEQLSISRLIDEDFESSLCIINDTILKDDDIIINFRKSIPKSFSSIRHIIHI